MKVKGKFSADVVGFFVKRNKSHDGQTAAVDIDVSVRQEDASKFGEDFDALAFGTMRIVQASVDEVEAVDKIAFMQDSIKPGRNVVLERHVVSFDGDRVEEQPELLCIKPVDGEKRVVVSIRIPVDADRAQQLGLASKVGKTLSVQFNPQQGELPYRKRKDEAAAEEAEASAH